jgi:hypothetical protein
MALDMARKYSLHFSLGWSDSTIIGRLAFIDIFSFCFVGIIGLEQLRLTSFHCKPAERHVLSVSGQRPAGTGQRERHDARETRFIVSVHIHNAVKNEGPKQPLNGPAHRYSLTVSQKEFTTRIQGLLISTLTGSSDCQTVADTNHPFCMRHPQRSLDDAIIPNHRLQPGIHSSHNAHPL